MSIVPLFLLVCTFVAVRIVTSSPTSLNCVGISPKFRLYVHFNLINRLFKSRIPSASLLPRPIIRGRSSAVRMKMKEVKMLLSLMDDRDSLAELGNDSVVEILHALFNHTDETTCNYLKEEFEVDCNEAGETRRVLQILKMKETIGDLLDILGTTESGYSVNPSCACIQQLIPDEDLRHQAIAAIGILGCH